MAATNTHSSLVQRKGVEGQGALEIYSKAVQPSWVRGGGAKDVNREAGRGMGFLVHEKREDAHL